MNTIIVPVHQEDRLIQELEFYSKIDKRNSITRKRITYEKNTTSFLTDGGKYVAYDLTVEDSLDCQATTTMFNLGYRCKYFGIDARIV